MSDKELDEIQSSRPALSDVPLLDESVRNSLIASRVSLVQHLLAWPEGELCRVSGVDAESLRATYGTIYSQFAARRQRPDALSRKDQLEPRSLNFTAGSSWNQTPIQFLGIRGTDIVELVGETGSAKTQLCLAAAASVLSAGRSVILLDSSACLCVDRIKFILAASHVPPEMVQRMLKRILHCPVATLDQAMETLHALKDDIMAAISIPPQRIVLERESESFENVSHDIHSILANTGLIVFDSPAALLSSALGWKRPDGWTGYAYGSMMAATLRQITHLSNAPALVSNRLIRGDREHSPRPALGRGWTHVPDARVFLEESRVCEADSGCVHVVARVVSKKTGHVPPVYLRVSPLGVVKTGG